MELRAKLKLKAIGKSNFATISAVFYTLLCAIAFFCIWLYGNDINTKVTTTIVMAICAILSSIAMLARLHGTFTQNIKTSFLFGAFLVFFASLIIYISLTGAILLAFYAFIAIVLSGLGTYFLVLSAKK
ncbi:MAG: hypothetical protein QME47_04005 [Candidatus Thermoplasmatota archaeon]|nr:hypothetical protein [Candidatus Thermoplasmatota archaeon]